MVQPMLHAGVARRAAMTSGTETSQRPRFACREKARRGLADDESRKAVARDGAFFFFVRNRLIPFVSKRTFRRNSREV